MFLAGDIGGTKTLLAFFTVEKGSYETIKKKTYRSKDYNSLEEILEEFLKDSQEKIKGACFGIAGPVVEGITKTPNLPWIVSELALGQKLKTNKVILINDLLANAHGIKTLSEKDFFVVNPGKENLKGNQALVSAGTGLGEAGFVTVGHQKIPFASEGGHCSFAPKNEEEIALYRYLQKKYQGHVSVERLLSGAGLENIYHFLVEEQKMPEISQEKLKEKTLPANISRLAETKESPTCEKALEIFIKIYGAEAGDVALKFLATGGVFLGGGIAPKILGFLKTPAFLKAFSDKGRLRSLLETIPIKVILNEETALRGAAYFVKN
jgi:glucokinase